MLENKKKVYISKRKYWFAVLCFIDGYGNDDAYISYVKTSGYISNGSGSITCV